MAVKKGDTVKIHYTGKLEDGTVFDSSEGREPLEFKVGEGQVIPGFETNVEGMEAGEEKEFTIEVEDAYGPKRDELVQEVPKERLPEDLEAEEGMMLTLQGPEGQNFPAQVTKVGDETVTIDLNHPLAGKDLTFSIKIESVE